MDVDSSISGNSEKPLVVRAEDVLGPRPSGQGSRGAFRLLSMSVTHIACIPWAFVKFTVLCGLIFLVLWSAIAILSYHLGIFKVAAYVTALHMLFSILSGLLFAGYGYGVLRSLRSLHLPPRYLFAAFFLKRTLWAIMLVACCVTVIYYTPNLVIQFLKTKGYISSDGQVWEQWLGWVGCLLALPFAFSWLEILARRKKFIASVKGSVALIRHNIGTFAIWAAICKGISLMGSLVKLDAEQMLQDTASFAPEVKVLLPVGVMLGLAALFVLALILPAAYTAYVYQELLRREMERHPEPDSSMPSEKNI